MRLFDTHAHYDADAFDADRMEVLSSMPGQGVELILNPGCDLKSSQTAVELAERFPFVYAAVGVHPEECADWNAEHDIPVLEALAQNPKVRAIGEIGLDYHWAENPPRELQQQAFHAQLDLAEKLNLPVIVHDRDAHHDCLEIVRAHPNVTGVYHCYSGGVEDAKTLMKLGWMISFTGSITFKNARPGPGGHRPAAPGPDDDRDRLPLYVPGALPGPPERLGPGPLGGRGHRRRKGLDPEEVARITLENGKRFFRI